MKILLLVGLLLGGCWIGGCSATLSSSAVHPNTLPSSAAKGPRRLTMDPITLQASVKRGELQVEILDPGISFDRAGELLSAQKFREALAGYNQILRQFPDSRFVSPALYNAGLAHEWLGEFSQAAARYREMIRRFGSSKEAIDASFRLGGCYAELRNWPASAEVLGRLLARSDLSASDRIEALARKGLAHFRLGDRRSCKSTLQEAIDFSRQVETVERLSTDYFLAMAYYYKAALPHLAFRERKVDSGEAMAKTLDGKAQFFLLSQAEYIKTIKVKNPYWATAAGFQIGSLYREFYAVLLTTLPDFTRQAAINARLAHIQMEQAQQQLTQVYLEEVHKAVAPLLFKAIRLFEKNVLMAERVGVRSDWVEKSRHQVNELKHLLSLPAQEAVKLVTKPQTLPEDQPIPKDKDSSPPKANDPADPDKTPAAPPADKSPMKEDDEPSQVIM